VEWRHSGSPHPRKFRVQKSAGKFSPRFFVIKTVSSSLTIFQRAKLSTRSITHLCWCNWRTFWRKKEVKQGCLLLVRQCPGSPSTCNPEETGLPELLVSWSPTLFSESDPVELPPVPWTEKATERSPFLFRRGGHCCRGELVGRTIFWIFLSGLQKLEQQAKSVLSFVRSMLSKSRDWSL